MTTTMIESLQADDGEAVLVLAAEIDLSCVEAISDVATSALAAGPGRLVIDASRVTFLNSSVLGALIRVHAVAREQGTSVALRHPTPLVQRLLRLSGLEAVLPVEP